MERQSLAFPTCSRGRVGGGGSAHPNSSLGISILAAGFRDLWPSVEWRIWDLRLELGNFRSHVCRAGGQRGVMALCAPGAAPPGLAPGITKWEKVRKSGMSKSFPSPIPPSPFLPATQGWGFFPGRSLGSTWRLQLRGEGECS